MHTFVNGGQIIVTEVPTQRRVMLEIALLGRSRQTVVVLIRKRMTVAEAVQAAKARNASGRVFVQSANMREQAWWRRTKA